MTFRDLLELAGLAAVTVAIWLASGLLWSALLAGGVFAVYLSHAWGEGLDFGPWAKPEPEPVVEAAKPIVRNRVGL